MLSLTVSPRFAETDALGHINNTVIPVWFEQGRHGIRVGAALCPCALVPEQVGPKHRHASRGECCRHLLDRIESARHRPEEVILVPAVNAEHRVRGPEY